MILFGFDSAEGVRKKVLEFQGKDTAVVLSDCKVKRSHKGRIQLVGGIDAH